MRHNIVTIGAATRDIFLISNAFQLIASAKFSTGMGECVALGTKIDVDKIVFATGGGATNSAATFALLGFNTATIVRLGDDEPGSAVLKDLRLHKIKTSFVRSIKGEQTGYSTLLTAKNGERSILVFRGVSSNFELRDIPKSALQAQALYLTSLGGKLDVLKHILTIGKAKKTTIALNPGRGELTRANALRELLPLVDVLIVNLEEAQMLLETNEASPVKLVRVLGRLCPKAILTNGPKGAYAVSQAQTWFIRPGNVKSISRTGAGDAFGSGTFAGLQKGLPINEALKVGMLNAESVIQEYGAKAGILRSWPTNAELKTVSVRLVK